MALGPRVRTVCVPVLLELPVPDAKDIDEHALRSNLLTNDEVALGDQVHFQRLARVEPIRRLDLLFEEAANAFTPLGDVWVVLNVVLGDDVIELVQVVTVPVDDREEL